jgi:hypothetical protein
MVAAPTLAPVSTSAAPAASERRVAHRHPAVGTVCRLDSEPDSASTRALVWNISASGVSMLVPKPLEMGSGVRGVLETIRGRHPLPVDMHVVHVKQLETGDYWMGAHFDRPLTATEMKPFIG